MFATTKTIALIFAAATAAMALPTATTRSSGAATGTETAPRDVTTHIISAGKGGALEFQPFNVVAPAGDVVEFHFAARNHSVVQSSFEEPCVQQAADGFNSGFGFAVAPDAAVPQSDRVYRFTVQDAAKPVWFFCGQADHCAKGMVGVVNANVDSGKTFDAYKAAAMRPGVATQLGAVTGGALGAAPAENTRINDAF